MFFKLSTYITTVLTINTLLAQSIWNRNHNPRDGVTSANKFLKKQSDYSLQFERTELIRFNKIFLKYAKIVTYKYNRTTAAVNVSAMYNVDVNNATSVMLQAYKFASNEYRLFPMRFQVNLCDAISENAIGTGNALKCGTFTGCPFKKGREIFVCKWVPDEAHFPPFLPNGQYMVEIQALYRNTETYFLRSYFRVSRKIVKK